VNIKNFILIHFSAELIILIGSFLINDSFPAPEETVAALVKKVGTMEKLLIVGNEQTVQLLSSGLAREHTILEATDPVLAMEQLLMHGPKVVILDLGLTSGQAGPEEAFLPREGFHCLKSMIESRPGTKVVVLIEKEEREAGYSAVDCGAYDFHHKPIELARLKMVIARAFHLCGMEEQRSRLQNALERSHASIEGIAGQCAAMRELFTALQKVALEKPELFANYRDHEGDADSAVGRWTAEVAISLEKTGGNSGCLQQERKVSRAAENLTLPTEPLNARTTLALLTDTLAELAEPLNKPTVYSNLLTEHLTLREVRDRVEKGMVSAAVGNCGGNIVKASELLGVSRPAFYDLMKKHGLYKPGARQ
jgi:DNA-binding NtrC family response regulator